MLLDIGLFFGRFHPLVVHLPIGFLLLALVLEFFGRKDGRFDAAVKLSLLLGALAAWAACLLGWLLSEGGYDEDLLGQHKWLGIGTAAVATVLWVAKSGWLGFPQKLFLPAFLVMTGLLSATGHLGGSLTHGEDYLTQYAPFLGGDGETKTLKATLAQANPDSVLVFQELIRPVMEQKCFQCHNESKQNGGLQMHTTEALQKGGDGGAVIAGNAMGSELFRRVTLNPESEKFMPPKGTPMSYREKQLLKWWLDNGADFEKKITELEIDEEVQQILLAEAGIDTRPRPLVETLQVPAPDQNAMDELRQLGFYVNPLSEESHLLEVNLTPAKSSLAAEDFEALKKVSAQITWLDFSNSTIQNADLAKLEGFSALTRLRLNNTALDDEGLAKLPTLPNLESLNLFGTGASDATLQHLAAFPRLKKLYLWQTKATPQGIEQLQSKLPKLEVDTGFTFQTVSKQ